MALAERTTLKIKACKKTKLQTKLQLRMVYHSNNKQQMTQELIGANRQWYSTV
jgi:hypothetical protein